MDILKYIATQILGQPPILVGLVACVGLIAQRKAFPDVVSGTMKTIVGFLILIVGAGVVVQTLGPIGPMLQEAFGFAGSVPNDEAIAAVALQYYGSRAALVMVVAFFTNVLVARITKYKYIYLTGHILMYWCLLVTALMHLAGFSDVIIIGVGGVLIGIYCPLIIALVQPYMDKVTNNAGIAYAHSSNLGAFLGGALGGYVGDPEDSTENIQLPRWASFFRDTTLATGMTMVVIFIGVSIAVTYFAEGDVPGGGNWVMWSIMQGLQFGAGVTVLLAGVRMLIGEIVPAFKGISQKIVPDAKPGLDCPVVMPYAPKAWLLGFLVSYPIGLLLTFVMVGLRFPHVVIAGVIPHFFCSGPAAVFGNATGGKRGAIVGAIVSSIIISFAIAALIPLTGQDLIASGTTWGETDYGVLGTIFGYLTKFIGSMLG